MRITADTNVLLRMIVDDDDEQSERAAYLLETAEIVVLSPQVLCELVWVLRSAYRVPRSDIAATLRTLISTHNVIVNRAAAEAGIALLEAGGDFADGLIAFEGAWMGADVFVSFDKKAVSLLKSRGYQTHLV